MFGLNVYEFVGNLNTPDECSGAWYKDFPYPVDGLKKIEPRQHYYDRARGCDMTSNWQAFIMTSAPVRRNTWVGDWPEGADMIVTCPIQRFSFHE